ncbi:MAG: DUF3450 domain-containing protein [Pseudomonadota bacterium]
MNPFEIGKRTSVVMTAVAGMALSVPVMAQSVDSVLRAEGNRLDRQVQSQQRVERIVSQTRSITDQYRVITKEKDGLDIYNERLQLQVEAQLAEIAKIEDSKKRASEVNVQILPLVTRMIDRLEQIIELDIPFLAQERADRLQTLKDIIDDPGVNTAEKFRKVMEAYTIEVNYGRKIVTYEGMIPIDGKEYNVDFLRLGRVALLFQTADQSVTGRYNPTTRQFEIDNSYRAEVFKGLQVAKQQIAPELLLVPVTVSE